MSYTRVNWKDYPNKTTPTNAENLNKMDKGIADLDAAFGSTNISGIGDGTGTGAISELLKLVNKRIPVQSMLEKTIDQVLDDGFYPLYGANATGTFPSSGGYQYGILISFRRHSTASFQIITNGAKFATRTVSLSNGSVVMGEWVEYVPNNSNANVTIGGTLYLTKTTDLSGTANNGPALVVGGAATSSHLEIDSNEIQAKSNGTTTKKLLINVDGGDVSIGDENSVITLAGTPVDDILNRILNLEAQVDSLMK